MTDRELLEAAAKAAGIEYGAKHSPTGSAALYLGPSGGWWNPLTDDSDALRLAVKLSLDIVTVQQEHIYIRAYSYETGFSAQELKGIDDGFATRRAIVRAAAAIGNNKE